MLTNRLNLPQPLVDLMGEYDPGTCDYTATSLMNPPRVTGLLHSGVEPQEDVADKASALNGVAVHKLFEKYLREGDEIAEQRLYLDHSGCIIGGQFDSLRFEKGLLEDLKTSSVNSFIYKKQEGFSEWEKQLNTYVSILEGNNYFVRKMRVMAFLVDWSPSSAYNAAKRGDYYPESPIMYIPLNVWGKNERDIYLRSRIKEHEAAKDILPECSREDRWEDKTDRPYAILNPKQPQRAVKLFPDRDSAAEELAYRQSSKNRKYVYVDGERVPENVASQDWFIQFRAPVSRRCAFYCKVAHGCTQWQELKKTLDMEDASGDNTPSEMEMVV